MMLASRVPTVLANILCWISNSLIAKIHKYLSPLPAQIIIHLIHFNFWPNLCIV